MSRRLLDGEGQLVATVADASIRSYTFTGLTTGASYDFGVAAFPDPENTESLADSETAWFDDITVNAVSSNVQVTIASTAENYYNLIVNYTISGLTDAGAEHGIVFSSTSSSPTRGSAGAEGLFPDRCSLPSPRRRSDSASRTQCSSRVRATTSVLIAMTPWPGIMYTALFPR